MGVNELYINFLLQLLNNEENIEIEKNQEDLIVNLYLTLLSLSNLEYSENIDQTEKNTIKNFLTRLNNLKVKIQLKRKPEELNQLSSSLINQYYENINILSIYIKDGIELENVINTMDAKSLTKMIDSITQDKMDKEYREEERNQKRSKIVQVLPKNNYYIENETIFIKTEDGYQELSIKEFIEMFSYLLNPDNYAKTYQDKEKKSSHKLIIANIIKTLLIREIKKEELNKILIPIILTYLLPSNLKELSNLDTSKFNIDNILISELYSLANKIKNNNININNTPKWRNISIPNEYLLEKISDMITKGMYYFKEDIFVFEHIDEKNTSNFKVSIKIENQKELLKNILENKLNNHYSKKNIK